MQGSAEREEESRSAGKIGRGYNQPANPVQQIFDGESPECVRFYWKMVPRSG